MGRPARAATIGIAFATYGGWLAARRLGIGPPGDAARRFAQLLEGLGTPFVKLGQHLSLRADVLPPAFTAALEGLQDQVTSFDPVVAVHEIEHALGRPIGQVFARFDLKPFAAASIAQVHSARLHDGREVIVKVRRPAIAARVDEDMRLLMALVRLAGPLAPLLRRHHAADIVRQLHRNLLLEMDLREEARNVRRFHDAFAGSAAVMVPDVMEELCTATVMVQQRSGGARVDAPRDHEAGQRLARGFIDAYVHQFFTLGYFHGDPHPGNLFVMEDGRLCFHDFGIVGHLDRRTRQALAAFMLAFAGQDSDWILESWHELGMVASDEADAPLRSAVTEILADCARRPLREWSIGGAFMRLLDSSRGSGVEVPLNLLVLARTVLLMEATVRRLDPEFRLVDALLARSEDVLQASTMVEADGATRLRYEAALASTEWRRFAAAGVRHLRRRGFKLQVDHEGLPQLGGTHLRAANRVSVALVTLGLYLASSLLMQHSLGPVVGGWPVLAVAGYLAAIWATIRLFHAVGRGL